MKGATDKMAKKIRIVIVEDQLLLRETLEHAINAEQEFDVLGSFGTAEDALQFLTGQEVDIVMLDRVLPGMNGVSLTRQIKEHYPSTKVLMVSMISNDESVSRALDAGVNGYLPKEIALSDLIKGIKQVYNGERVICYQLTEKLIKIYT